MRSLFWWVVIRRAQKFVKRPREEAYGRGFVPKENIRQN